MSRAWWRQFLKVFGSCPIPGRLVTRLPDGREMQNVGGRLVTRPTGFAKAAEVVESLPEAEQTWLIQSSMPSNSQPRRSQGICCHKHLEQRTGLRADQVLGVVLHPPNMGMILCQTCGNKRCPEATNCELACTGSNDPGQAGSIYE